MSRSFIVLIALLCMAVTSTAQIRTEEKRVTKDSTGREVVTEAVVISTSEDITPRKHMIIINPLKFFLFYNLSYFHTLTPFTVVGGGLQTTAVKDWGGFGFNLEARMYPSGKAPRGIYFAPNLSFNRISTNESDYTWNQTEQRYVFTERTENNDAVSIGGLVGWQWFPGDEFAIGFGIGLDYYFPMKNSHSFLDLYDKFTPAFRFDIGYAW